MSDIRKLKDNNDQDIYPVTVEHAVFDENGVSLSEKLDKTMVWGDTVDAVDFELEFNLVSRIEELESKAGVANKTENDKYSTRNGIKEFTCVQDGYIENFYIEGKSLFNLFSYKYSQGFGSNDEAIWVHIDPNYRVLFTEGKTHTIVNTTGKRIFVDIYTNGTNAYKRNLLIEGYSSIVEVLGADEHYEKCTGFFSDGWTAEDTYAINSTLVIVEGDYANEDIKYFSGINSLGQNRSIELWNQSVNGNLAVGLTETGTWGETDGLPGPAVNCVRGITKVSVANPSKTLYYWTDKNYKLNYYYYDANENFVNKYTAVIPNGAKYMRYRTTAGNKESDESVKIAISYNPISEYIEPKIESTKFDYALRSLPDGTCDTIEKRGDEYYLIQRCYEFKYNNHDFSWVSDIGGVCIQVNISNFNTNLLPGVRGTMLCNLIQPYDSNNIPDTNDTSGYEGIFYVQGNNTLCIRLNKSKLTSTDHATIKQYLMDNNYTAVLKLEKPIVRKIHNIDIRTFEGGNEFFIDNCGLPTNVSFEVTNSISNNSEVIKDKINDIADSCSYLQGICNSNTNNITNLNNNITRIDNTIESVQLKKLTDASGAFIRLTDSTNIDTIYSGCNDILNATGTLPGSLVSTNNNILIECKRRSDSYVRQICYDVRSINSWERVRTNGVWSAWRSL